MIKLWKLTVLAFVSYAFILPGPGPELQESIKRGEETYTSMCITCHMGDGSGVAGVFPPLAQSDYLNDREASIRAIKHGLQGEITVNGETYNNIMTPLGLDDQEVADVLNYVLNNWGNEPGEMVTEEEVAEVAK